MLYIEQLIFLYYQNATAYALYIYRIYNKRFAKAIMFKQKSIPGIGIEFYEPRPQSRIMSPHCSADPMSSQLADGNVWLGNLFRGYLHIFKSKIQLRIFKHYTIIYTYAIKT